MQAFFATMLGITSAVGIAAIGFILYNLILDYFEWLRGIKRTAIELDERISHLEKRVYRLESEASTHDK